MNRYGNKTTKNHIKKKIGNQSISGKSHYPVSKFRLFIHSLTFSYFPYLECYIIPYRQHNSNALHNINTISLFLRLAGKIRIKLSTSKYCAVCRKNRIPEQEYLCDSCKKTQRDMFLRCVHEGCGNVFSDTTHYNSNISFCVYPENIGLCSTAHVLYIGSFGDFTNVGITRADRKREEFFLRHIEQGLDFALTFITEPDLTLPEAQRLESEISEKLEIPKEIPFKYKVEVLNRPQFRGLKKFYARLRGEVNTILRAEGYRIVNVVLYDLRKNYIVPEDKPVHTYKMIRKIVDGRIVGFKGNVLFLRDENGTLFAFNGSLLLNHYIRYFEIENPLEPYKNIVVEV